MKNIAFIIPYFGILPNYFDLWLLSVKLNPTIDFFLVTDIKFKSKYPDNVHIISMTFPQLKKRIQKLFGSDIRIESPYKICDYRPSFGLLFKEFLKEYDFWGYCDVDLIFGNIRKFTTDEMLNNYKKLYSHGHFVIVKNTEEMNNIFKLKHHFPAFTFDEINATDLATHFDEWRGYSLICHYANLPCYEKEEDYCDIDYNQYQFRLTNHNIHKRPQIFQWQYGKLFLYYVENNTLFKKEYMYVHMQKRTMENKVNHKEDGFFIIPNSFIDKNLSLDVQAVKIMGTKKGFYKKKYDNLLKEIIHNLKYGGIQYRIKLWRKNLKFKGEKV